MADHANTFLLITILALVTIILVSGMKYAAASRQSRLQSDGGTATRQALSALQGDLSDIKTRLAMIEKILKDVE